MKNTATRHIAVIRNRRYLITLQRWKSFTLRRKQFRSLLQSVFERHVRTASKLAFTKILQNAILTKAQNEILRVGTRFVLRLKMRAHFYATLIQSQVRMLVGKKLYQSILYKRRWAAVEIQRHLRGIFTRKFAFKVYTTFIEDLFEKLQREKHKTESRRENGAAQMIQNMFIKRKKDKMKQDEVKKRMRKISVEEDIEKSKSNYIRDRKVYESQIEEFYKEMRQSWEDNNILITQTNFEIKKLRTLRRKLASNKKKQKRQELENITKLGKEKRQQEWENDWNRRAIERSDDFKTYCKNCIDCPDTRTEVKMGKELKAKIKIRYDIVLRQILFISSIFRMEDMYKQCASQ